MPPKFIGKAKVSRQGQVTLPLEARKDLHIPIESDIYWYEIDNYLIVIKELLSPKELEDKIKKKGLSIKRRTKNATC